MRRFCQVHKVLIPTDKKFYFFEAFMPNMFEDYAGHCIRIGLTLNEKQFALHLRRQLTDDCMFVTDYLDIISEGVYSISPENKIYLTHEEHAVVKSGFLTGVCGTEKSGDWLGQKERIQTFQKTSSIGVFNKKRTLLDIEISPLMIDTFELSSCKLELTNCRTTCARNLRNRCCDGCPKDVGCFCP